MSAYWTSSRGTRPEGLRIIESSRKGFDPGRIDGNMAHQLEELRRLLLKLPPGEIVDFRNHLLEQMDAAFRWDLWGAAYIIAGGCSDDGFADFRSWLISMERRVFENAVSNPESLVDVTHAPGVEDVFFEELQYVPAQAYEELTGRR
ncbi:MAG: DUF4240 domain-containing protein [Archangium sp.]